MSSFMQRQLVPYAILCRLGGCFFIRNFRKPLENAKVTWKSVYTAYSATLMACCFGVQVLFIAQSIEIHTHFPGIFSLTLLLVMETMLSLKALLNAIIMTTRSNSILSFFQKSSKFEENTGFTPAKRRGFRGLGRHRWSVFRRSLAIIGLVSNYVIVTLPLIMGLTRVASVDLSFVRMLGTIFTVVFVLLYDSLPYMVVRSCSEVLVEYLRAQRKMFQSCSGLGSSRFDNQLSRQLEVIRHNLGTIRDLKDTLNDIWHVPLAVMSAGILMIDCVVCYAMFHDGFHVKEIPLSVAHCVYTSFAFMDMACVSQALTDEAQRLKDVTKVAFTMEKTGRYVQQLRYLYETIDPEGMCLSGGGYFQLNKSLLVTMAGTIITYTVIISQTMDGLGHSAAPTNSTSYTAN